MSPSPAPVGVRIVIVILLVSGLALAALPATVLLRGRGQEPGTFEVLNETGGPLSCVRIVRLVGEQERLLGAARDVADGSAVHASFQQGKPLRVRLELTRGGTERDVPISFSGLGTRVIHVGPELGIHIEETTP